MREVAITVNVLQQKLNASFGSVAEMLDGPSTNPFFDRESKQSGFIPGVIMAIPRVTLLAVEQTIASLRVPCSIELRVRSQQSIRDLNRIYDAFSLGRYVGGLDYDNVDLLHSIYLTCEMMGHTVRACSPIDGSPASIESRLLAEKALKDKATAVYKSPFAQTKSYQEPYPDALNSQPSI